MEIEVAALVTSRAGPRNYAEEPQRLLPVAFLFEPYLTGTTNTACRQGLYIEALDEEHHCHRSRRFLTTTSYNWAVLALEQFAGHLRPGLLLARAETCALRITRSARKC